jgi:hypothetical protein
MCPNSPESWVEVVEATTMDLSCAKLGAQDKHTNAMANAMNERR